MKYLGRETRSEGGLIAPGLHWGPIYPRIEVAPPLEHYISLNVYVNKARARKLIIQGAWPTAYGILRLSLPWWGRYRAGLCYESVHYGR